MDPITLGVLGAAVVLLLGAGLVYVLIRAWLRTMVRMVKVVVYLGLFVVVGSAVGLGIAYVMWPEVFAGLAGVLP